MSRAEPADETVPYAFVSYARRDKDYVVDLVEHLQRMGVVVWIDTETDYGERWPKLVRDKVDGCAAFVVVMSAASDESAWVEREVIRAQQREKPILPLLLDGLPFFEVSTHQYDDVTDRRMPTRGYVSRLQHLTSSSPPSDPNDEHIPDDPTIGLRYWIDEGIRLLMRGNAVDALEAFATAVEINPRSAEAHADRARAQTAIGDHAGALKSVESALALEPHSFLAYFAKGNTLFNLGRWAEAIEAFDRGIQLDPGYAPTQANRGDALYALGRHDEALEAYELAIQLDPENAAALHGRGRALHIVGRQDRGQ